MSDWIWILSAVLFVIIGPVIGPLLAGIDRKISARMQNRVGPPIRQPLYDVKKFLAKEQVTPNRVQDFYVMVFLLFTIATGVLFFTGQDLLLIIFTLTLSEEVASTVIDGSCSDSSAMVGCSSSLVTSTTCVT